MFTEDEGDKAMREAQERLRSLEGERRSMVGERGLKPPPAVPHKIPPPPRIGQPPRAGDAPTQDSGALDPPAKTYYARQAQPVNPKAANDLVTGVATLGIAIALFIYFSFIGLVISVFVFWDRWSRMISAARALGGAQLREIRWWDDGRLQLVYPYTRQMIRAAQIQGVSFIRPDGRPADARMLLELSGGRRMELPEVDGLRDLTIRLRTVNPAVRVAGIDDGLSKIDP